MQQIASEETTSPVAPASPTTLSEIPAVTQTQAAVASRPEPEETPGATAPKAAESTTKDTDGAIPTEQPKSQSPAPPLLDKVLSAVSTASETTLIAGFSGVALLLSLVLGRIGLLLVGIALGATLHAAIQTKNGLPEAVHARRKDGESNDEEVRGKVNQDDQDVDFSALPPRVANAMAEFTNSIAKDYINYWYMPLVPDDSSFPATCHQHLSQTFMRFSKHISSKRPADVFLMTVFTMSNTMIVFMRELSQAMSGAKDLQPAIRAYLSANPNSALALMLHRGQQNRKLSVLSHEIIEHYAPKDLRSCEPVALFLRHILRSVILSTTVEKFSDPEFLNEWVVYLLEEKEDTGPSKEGVGAVLQAFDRSVAGAAAQTSLPRVDTSTSTPPLPRSTNQSPTTRKENMRPPSRHANGNGQALDGAPNMHAANMRSNGFHRNGSMDVPTSQHQSPVDSPPHSPVSDQLKRTPSNASSRASVSDLAMTPHKTSSESSHSTGCPPPIVEQPKRNPVALLNARVTVLDGGPTTNPPKMLRSKPNYAFIIQLEPLNSAGWIVMRKYQDFEVLHDTLRRIAAVSGAEKYLMAYSDGLPTWRERFGDELVALLELYLRIVLSEERLVETEALHRFFEKDEGKRERDRQPQSDFSSPWRSSTSLENVGKNVLGALTKAPQSASEGSKALFGGIKKALTSQSPLEKEGDTFRSPFGFMNPSSTSRNASRTRRSVTEDAYMPLEKASAVPNLHQETGLSMSPVDPAPSENRGRFSVQYPTQSQPDEAKPPLPPRRASSLAPSLSRTGTPFQGHHGNDPMAQSLSALPERGAIPSAADETVYLEPAGGPDLDSLSLPPPPSEIDGMSEVEISGKDRTYINAMPLRLASDLFVEYKPHAHFSKVHEGISEQETQYVLEVMFSVINELYNLSSAWMLRRSFLNIAKSMMLRPGNATLLSMQDMIQSDVLDANTSQEAIADYVRQLRKNALPTAAELEEWEKTRKIRTPKEKDELRHKARELLSESLPQGLTALLGVSQTKEAIYQLFDALQERDIARGFWTAILAETMQVVCQ
ncbi:hypothetical protein ABW19_dt0207726 [Dactylella cylindrospora]|nr:hypothetical protein ABW19_dt0207726 [Dactylella cylindrospora]